MSCQSFEELDAWQRSCDVSVRMYEVLKECRDFGLKDQISISLDPNPLNLTPKTLKPLTHF